MSFALCFYIRKTPEVFTFLWNSALLLMSVCTTVLCGSSCNFITLARIPFASTAQIPSS